MLDRIESKTFLFLLFSNACRSDSKSPISPITRLLRVPWFVLLKSFLFLYCIFPVRKSIFSLKAGSGLDETSIPLWSAFKQLWERAASLLSSGCNHLNRSTKRSFQTMMFEMIFFVGFLLPQVSKILRLLWTIWDVYKDLIWRTALCVCGFKFAIYCCRWLQIIFISGLFFDSDCFFDYTRLCVTSAWFYPR